MSEQLYHWNIKNSAKKEFKRLDRPVQARIISWLNTNISGSSNPRAWGKAMQGGPEKLWRYRVGAYRIIASIDDGMFTVLVVKLGKRGDVYKD
jgi:mRNA interferase RelE/StbE